MSQNLFIEQKVAKAFQENDLHYDYDVNPNGEVNVTVEGGDWKHDHLTLDHVMTLNGFTPLSETRFGEPSGDDSYSATHVYKLTQSY